MKTIVIAEEFEIPGTGITLEKGDTIEIKEGNPRVGTKLNMRDIDTIDLFDFRDIIVNRLEIIAKKIDNLSIMTDYFADQPDKAYNYRMMLSEVLNALTAFQTRIDTATDRF